MAQPQYAVEYIGAESIKQGDSYTSANFKTKYPSATMMKMKSEGISVSINGTTMFLTKYDDESYIPTTATTYIFNKDCVIAIGRYFAVSV